MLNFSDDPNDPTPRHQAIAAMLKEVFDIDFNLLRESRFSAIVARAKVIAAQKICSPYDVSPTVSYDGDKSFILLAFDDEQKLRNLAKLVATKRAESTGEKVREKAVAYHLKDCLTELGLPPLPERRDKEQTVQR